MWMSIWAFCFLILIDDFEILPDSPLSKRLIEKISIIQRKGDEQPKLQKSVSLDDLQERTVLSGINVDPRMKASRDLLLQRGVRNTSTFEDPSGSKKGNGKPGSKSSSSVKTMITAFESTSPQVFFFLDPNITKQITFIYQKHVICCLDYCYPNMIW